jgi:hypothetical protein
MKNASMLVGVSLVAGLIAWSAFTSPEVAAQGQGAAETVVRCRFGGPQPPAAKPGTCILEGTWEFHGIQGPLGDTITFNADGTWTSSELSTGTYKVIGNSILIDVNNDDATNYVAWTYIGTLPDGQMIFSYQNTLGFKPVR